ncbi:MerR family transcriptional regulator [Actinosynnema pretiosum subsp. pretiosum]|uniref:MerR family transcriptional regulator n=1 Tax=Actinosynnema pretiosum subsp. pretiosum TaxID=103721 RepID=A0AA45R612_9PSEU|nr:MerR family transcriptional regulator [Actinosynnema mirum]QUF06542.1 MerR family transcriptional regulator [Actinosynnema pretiosum subsp. pretiosum]
MLWSPGAVARMLAISPTTLRTWDRRYGLGPSTREEGKHRRYSAEDVDRLRRMVALTGQGVAPASAAAMALSEPGGAAEAPERPEEVTAAERRGFARAATRLDAPLMVRLVGELIQRHGVVRAWDCALVPFLVAAGERAAADARGVEVEHLATACISRALSVYAQAAEQPRLPVLLACAPEEQHSLPLDVLAAALAERGCASRNLGARVPPTALLDATALLSPVAVMVWAHATEQAEATPVAELVETGRTVLVGGPGWANAPAGSRYVGSLNEAIDTILSLNRF